MTTTNSHNTSVQSSQAAQTANQADTHAVPAPGNAHRNLPEGAEIRGFGLYVGLDEVALAQDGTSLEQVLGALRQTLAAIAPSAESHATLALAAHGAGGSNVEVARFALGEPASRAAHSKQVKEEQDRAASGITFDLSRHRVLLDNVPAPLTHREFELLKFFLLREGLNISRQEIIDTLWADADPIEVPNERTIDVHIRRLRVKLGKYQDIIRTVRGIGYRFDRHADVHVIPANRPSHGAY